MSITTTNFVSVGYTLKVWRKWARAQLFKVLANAFRHSAEPEDRIIWIFGSGRSGTTWLMELLQRGYRLHGVFEYFHPDNPALPKEIAESGRRFAENVSELGLTESDVLAATNATGRNAWIDRTNPVISLRRRRGVVLKDVAYRLQHSPALLRAEPRAEPVLMLRQPVGMLKSLLTSNELWNIDSLFDPGDLTELVHANRDQLTDWAISALEAGLTKVADQSQRQQVEVLRWCLHNLTALERLSSDSRLRVVIYERLSVDYLAGLFGAMIDDPKFEKRSSTDWGRKPRELDSETQQQIAESLALMGLAPFVSVATPWLLDLEALVADYRKPAVERLAPRLLR